MEYGDAFFYICRTNELGYPIDYQKLIIGIKLHRENKIKIKLQRRTTVSKIQNGVNKLTCLTARSSQESRRIATEHAR